MLWVGRWARRFAPASAFFARVTGVAAASGPLTSHRFSLSLTVLLFRPVDGSAARVWMLIGAGVALECVLLVSYPYALGGLP